MEISYGFSPEAYDNCPGYWDEELKWHSEQIHPQAWMIDGMIRMINEDKAAV